MIYYGNNKYFTPETRKARELFALQRQRIDLLDRRFFLFLAKPFSRNARFAYHLTTLRIEDLSLRICALGGQLPAGNFSFA